MDAHELTFETKNRFWSTEREAVNFFARHDGVELEFIVTKGALVSVGRLSTTLNEESALLTFDNYEDLFLRAATRVWRAADDSKPVYFVTDDDVKESD
jgi:hypothetical protein